MSSSPNDDNKIKKNKGGRKRTKLESAYLTDNVFNMMVDEYQPAVIKEKLCLSDQELLFYMRKAQKRFENVIAERSRFRVGKRISQIQDLYNMAIQENDRAEARKCWDSATKFEIDSELIEGSPDRLEQSATKFFEAISLLVGIRPVKKVKNLEGEEEE